jgi:hypothetical protein
MAAAKESVDIARASIIKEKGLTIFYFQPAAGMDKLFSDAAPPDNTSLLGREGKIPGTRELILHESNCLPYEVAQETVWI